MPKENLKPCPFCATKAFLSHKNPLTQADCVSCSDEDCWMNKWNGLHIEVDSWNKRPLEKKVKLNTTKE